jgi:Uma2 family endonuclease
MSVVERPAGNWTAADLAAHLGDIPLSRIRFDPAPGTATEQDVLDIRARERRLCELTDGVLVEKTMGYYESYLAMRIAYFIQRFLESHPLGMVAGPDGMVRLARDLVRIPDVSYISWARLPGGRPPRQPILGLAPDLAVEVLSESNTPGEMKDKLGRYFEAGVELVWYVDGAAKTVEVFSAPERRQRLGEADVLAGGDVLPGFELPLGELFKEPGAGPL